MKTVFVNIGTSGDYFNLGDANCSPRDFVDSRLARQCWTSPIEDDVTHIVFGGGGMLMAPCLNYLKRLGDARGYLEGLHYHGIQLAIWGAGLNTPFDGGVMAQFAKVLNRFSLVGIRDKSFAREHGFDWVPCASCMLPEFGQPHPAIGREIPVLGYFQDPGLHYLLPQHYALPRKGWRLISNRDRRMDLGYLVNAMDRSQVFVTDSYHGAYWAALRNHPKIVLYGDLGARMATGLPFALPHARTPDELAVMIRYGVEKPAPAGFLETCRSANFMFKHRLLAAGFCLDNEKF